MKILETSHVYSRDRCFIYSILYFEIQPVDPVMTIDESD